MTRVHRLVLMVIDHDGSSDEDMVADVEYVTDGFVVQHDVHECTDDGGLHADDISARNKAAIELFEDSGGICADRKS